MTLASEMSREVSEVSKELDERRAAVRMELLSKVREAMENKADVEAELPGVTTGELYIFNRAVEYLIALEDLAMDRGAGRVVESPAILPESRPMATAESL